MSIITEFCAGGTLYELLKKEISWKIKIKILLDIAIGINFLHTNKPSIIHRDLKSLK
jgi:serine/threonine protein kinase